MKQLRHIRVDNASGSDPGLGAMIGHWWIIYIKTSIGVLIAPLNDKKYSLKSRAANSLLRNGGTAIIIHEKPVDYVSQPTGESEAGLVVG